MWEVFDPVDGRPLRLFRWQWQARWACRRSKMRASGWRLDYARQGRGWTGNIGCTRAELLALAELEPQA